MSSRVKRRPGRPEASAPGRPEASARPSTRPSEWALLRSVVYYRACAQLERHPTLWRIVLLGLGLGLLLALGVRSHQSAVCRTATIEPHAPSVVALTSLSQPVDGAVCAQARLHAQCARRLCQCTRNARAVHAHFTRSADALSTKPHTSGVTRRPCAWHTAHPAPPPCPPTPRRPARAAGARAPRGSLARRGSGQARGGVASVRCRGAGRRGGGGAPGANAAAAGRGGQEDLLTPHLLGERGAAGRTRSLTLTLTPTLGRRVQPMS